MPEDQPLPEISQTLRLLLEVEASKAKGLIDKLTKIQKRVKLNEKALAKLDKIYKKHEKTLVKTRKSVDKIILSQKKMADKVRAVSERVNKNTKALRRQAAQMKQSTKASRSYTSSLISLAAVAGGAFFGLKKLQEFVDTRFTQALLTGAESLDRIAQSAGANISADRAFELITKFQQQDISTLALGLREEIQSGLLDAQAELAKGIGVGRANQLMLDLTKATLDSPKRLEALLTGPGSLEQRLLSNVNIQNLSQTIQALNALKLPELAAEDKVPESLQTAAKISEALESMNKAIDKATESMFKLSGSAIQAAADFATAHPVATALGTAGAVGATAVGASGISGLVNFLLLRKLLPAAATVAAPAVGAVATTPIPQILGFGARQAATAATGTAAATATGSGALAIGGGFAVALGGLLALGDTIIKLLQNRPEATLSESAMRFITGQTLEEADFERTKEFNATQQQANRAQLDAITKIRRQVFEQAGLSPLDFLAEKIESFSEAQDIEVSKLRDKFKELKKSYGIREVVKFTEIQDKLADKTEETKDKAKEAAKELQKTKEALKGVGQAAATSIAPLIEQARQMQDLQLTSSLEQSRTQLRQVERDIASVFHPLLGLSQNRALQDQRLAEIKSLEDILGVMEIRDDRDRIEANKMILTINQLKLSNRQDSQKLLNAFEGQLGQIIGVGGRFSKLIISLSEQKNIGVGIEKGISNLHKTIPFLTGQVGPSKGLLPQTPAQVFGPNFFKIIDSLDVRKAKREIAKLGKLTPPVIAPPPTAAPPTVAPPTVAPPPATAEPPTTKLEGRVKLTKSKVKLFDKLILDLEQKEGDNSQDIKFHKGMQRYWADLLKQAETKLQAQQSIPRPQDIPPKIAFESSPEFVGPPAINELELPKAAPPPPFILPAIPKAAIPPEIVASPPLLQKPVAPPVEALQGPPQPQPKMITARKVPRTKEQEQSTSQKQDMQRKMPSLGSGGKGQAGRSAKKGAQMISDGLTILMQNGDLIDFLMSENNTSQDKPTNSGRSLASG